MTSRLTAIAVICALAAPAVGLAQTFDCEMASETACCCPESPEVDEAAGPAISSRCCCDVDRRDHSAEIAPSVAIAPSLDVVIASQAPAPRSLAALSWGSERLPEPRGPPPRSTLLSQKTSLLL